jgi:hypothetical protein
MKQRKMSNNPRHSNAKRKDQDIKTSRLNVAVTLTIDPILRSSYLLLYKENESSVEQMFQTKAENETLTTPKNFEKRLPSSCKFLPRVLASRKVLRT